MNTIKTLAIKIINTWRFGQIKTLVTSCSLGDIHLMAIKEIIGNISSGAQHSKDEVVSSRSYLLANKFLAWTP